MRKYTIYLFILIAFICSAKAHADNITIKSVESVIQTCNTEFYKDVTEETLLKSFFSSIHSQIEYMGLSSIFKDINLTGKAAKDLENIQSALKEAGLCEAAISTMYCEAITFMLKSLEDRGTAVTLKSSYVPSLSLIGYEEGGIGISVDDNRVRDSYIIIRDVVPSMPAYNAGIRTGDRIVMINATHVRDLSNRAATDIIRGEIGTIINITYLPNGQRIRKTVSLERKWLSPGRKYVTGKMLDNDILYIGIRRIGANISQNIIDIIKQNKTAKKIILDLRYCAGERNHINEVTDIFIPKGTTVCTLNYRTEGKLETVQHITEGNYNCTLPCAVIINEKTSSAGIATSAILKSSKRAVLIGANALWEDTSENIHDFGDNYIYSINNFYYTLNNGEKITCGYTLKPDEEIKQELYKLINNDNEDIQLKRAIKILER